MRVGEEASDPRYRFPGAGVPLTLDAGLEGTGLLRARECIARSEEDKERLAELLARNGQAKQVRRRGVGRPTDCVLVAELLMQFVVPAIHWLAGLCAGTLLVVLVALLFVVRHRAVDLGWAWNFAEIRRLVAIGCPILLTGTVSSLLRSLDKLMILGYTSDREFQLGCYSLALMVTSQLFGLGNMLSTVTGPRYGEKYGHSGDARAVARVAARASELVAAAMAQGRVRRSREARPRRSGGVAGTPPSSAASRSAVSIARAWHIRAGVLTG